MSAPFAASLRAAVVIASVLVPAAWARAALVMVGRDASASTVPEVKLYETNGQVNTLIGGFTPYAGFTGGVRVGAGDVSGDGIPDIITGATAFGHVKAFEAVNKPEFRSFLAYAAFTGGVYVAAGDVTGDGRADIITGAEANGHVKAFDAVTNAEVRSFLAYVNFSGEVRVAVGDITGDGRADIITGAGPGAFGHVKAFDGITNAEVRSFLAYPNFNGGVYVAAGDVNGDGRADIITGSEANSQVKVFDGITNDEIRSFFAFPGFVGAVRVAAGDVNGDGHADLITSTGPGGLPTVQIFDGKTNASLGSFDAYDRGFTGGVYVAYAVPEPSAGVFLLVVTSGLLVRRPRRATGHGDSMGP